MGKAKRILAYIVGGLFLLAIAGYTLENPIEDARVSTALVILLFWAGSLHNRLGSLEKRLEHLERERDEAIIERHMNESR